ncbi:MAG TPA: ABC transporter ATP-binding protein [Ramlibacter sp.]|jgi:multiple sugar transport system ATP-binding protein
MHSLELRGIVKEYGAFRAVKDVSFAVEPGEFIVMVGPSGCGKSTLLRSIAGLETISGGTISINGRDITTDEPSDRGVAMVFQNYALYPHMSVRDNMGFALKIAGRPRQEIDAAVRRAAEILRITEHLDKKPRQLSGGQKQRVAIGRAITRSPDIFLFDEPLSNLDAALRSQMRIELGRLHAELKATMVYVTHDQTEAMTMASRIVVLNAGIIEQIGSPLDLYNRPANRFVAGFLGSPRMNFFKGTVEGSRGKQLEISLEGLEGVGTIDFEPGNSPIDKGEPVLLGVRPESFAEGAGPWTIDAKVAVVESLGRETMVYADAGVLRTYDSESQEGFLAVHRSSQLRASYGDPISFSIDPSSTYLFASDGRTIGFPNHTV